MMAASLPDTGLQCDLLPVYPVNGFLKRRRRGPAALRSPRKEKPLRIPTR